MGKVTPNLKAKVVHGSLPHFTPAPAASMAPHYSESTRLAHFSSANVYISGCLFLIVFNPESLLAPAKMMSMNHYYNSVAFVSPAQHSFPTPTSQF